MRLNIHGIAWLRPLWRSRSLRRRFASATDLEVIHWWTSKGESAAVSQFAKAFDNDGQGDHWIDSAIALGQTARATIMQRVLGGDPPGAAQFNPGREYEELIKNNQLLAARRRRRGRQLGQTSSVRSRSARRCLVDGHWYCVPVNIHSWPWALVFDDRVREGRASPSRRTSTSSSPTRRSSRKPASFRSPSAATAMAGRSRAPSIS